MGVGARLIILMSPLGPLGVHCSLLPLGVLSIFLFRMGTRSLRLCGGAAFRLTILNMCLQRVVAASALLR